MSQQFRVSAIQNVPGSLQPPTPGYDILVCVGTDNPDFIMDFRVPDAEGMNVYVGSIVEYTGDKRTGRTPVRLVR